MTQKKTLKERLQVWSKLLVSSKGATYQRLNVLLADGSSEDYMESLRKDLSHIRKLLSGRDEKFSVEGKKEKVFRLSSYVDLAALHEIKKSKLIYLLTHTKGFLPEEFIETLSPEYIEAQNSVNRTIVSFETDYDNMECMDLYQDIYNAIIDKETLTLHYHRMHCPDKELVAYFCPDFLKQYHSSWYVFGMLKEENSSNVDFVPGRIPLAAIDYISHEDSKVYPYISTNRDYETYFSEIIGLERDENCEQEQIDLRVSNKIFDRIMTTPLHSSQERNKSLDNGKYKGVTLNVRRNKELIRLLLSYGSDVEVVSPAILRRQVLKEMNRMQKLYMS